MDLLTIVMMYLKNNGYEGLYQEGHCSCILKDLMPCGEPCIDCQPGYQFSSATCEGNPHVGEKPDMECDGNCGL